MTERTRRPTASQAPVPAPSDPARSEFLRTKASVIGTTWATTIRDGLLDHGREAAGGFPGTMSEIRRHVGEFMQTSLGAAHMRQLSSSEHEWSARIAYAAARTYWRTHGTAEPPEPR